MAIIKQRYTPAEVADILDINSRAVTYMMDRDQIGFIRPGRRHRRIPREALEVYIRQVYRDLPETLERKLKLIGAK